MVQSQVKVEKNCSYSHLLDLLRMDVIRWKWLVARKCLLIFQTIESSINQIKAQGQSSDLLHAIYRVPVKPTREHRLLLPDCPEKVLFFLAVKRGLS